MDERGLPANAPDVRVNIRMATSDDAVCIAALHALSWQTAYRGMLSDAYLDQVAESERRALWISRLTAPSLNQYVVVAEHEGLVIGFSCAYGQHEPTWGTLLENLHVRPALKRSGIGGGLLRHVARWSAWMAPGAPMHLWVLEPNTSAQAFYRAHGATCVEKSHWETPDGRRIPQLRFAWRSTSVLAGGA